MRSPRIQLPTTLRDRIVRLERMRIGDLSPHPCNWREHGESQSQALAGLLREIGIADVVLAWPSERNGGKLTLYDGHLRKDIKPDQIWPVLITDLNDAEADLMLASLDPISALATADVGALDALLASVKSDEAAVTAMLADLAEQNGIGTNLDTSDKDERLNITERFEIVIDCEDETTQVELLERFEGEGLKCRALVS